MPLSRSEIVNYYLQRDTLLKEAAAAAATEKRYQFRGPDLSDGVVVRVDLNGYSDRTQGRSIGYRVKLLNNFFTKVLEYLDECKGIYFRDEGDCVVSIFSTYFGLADPYASVEDFCKKVVSNYYGYGVDLLTAKAIVAAGEIAIYQKSPEVGTGDWSAEGEPFVRAVRLEQAVESKQQIYFFADEYRELFSRYTIPANMRTKYYWQLDYIKEQVQGLRFPRGWVELAIIEYIPEGRIYNPYAVS